MNDDKDEGAFDKFMDKIVSEEAQRQVRAEDELEETPGRVYIRKYRELPQNRIVYRRTK